jgi:hypothetical protein
MASLADVLEKNARLQDLSDPTLIELMALCVTQRASGGFPLNVFVGSLGSAYILGRLRGRKESAMAALLDAQDPTQ